MDKNGKWITMLNEEPKENVNMFLVPMEIRGYRILMLDLNVNTVDRSFGKIYGIKKI